MQIPPAMLADEQAALGRLVETLADNDDTLLEKVLEDIKPTPEELYRDMRKDLLAGAVIEVLVGGAEHANGVRRLWKALRHDTPDPTETAERRGIIAGWRRARAGLQDRLCRPHRQAVLCKGLERNDYRRRATGRHPAWRHLSFR